MLRKSIILFLSIFLFGFATSCLKSNSDEASNTDTGFSCQEGNPYCLESTVTADDTNYVSDTNDDDATDGTYASPDADGDKPPVSEVQKDVVIVVTSAPSVEWGITEALPISLKNKLTDVDYTIQVQHSSGDNCVEAELLDDKLEITGIKPGKEKLEIVAFDNQNNEVASKTIEVTVYENFVKISNTKDSIPSINVGGEIPVKLNLSGGSGAYTCNHVSTKVAIRHVTESEEEGVPDEVTLTDEDTNGINVALDSCSFTIKANAAGEYKITMKAFDTAFPENSDTVEFEFTVNQHLSINAYVVRDFQNNHFDILGSGTNAQAISSAEIPYRMGVAIMAKASNAGQMDDVFRCEGIGAQTGGNIKILTGKDFVPFGNKYYLLGSNTSDLGQIACLLVSQSPESDIILNDLNITVKGNKSESADIKLDLTFKRDTSNDPLTLTYTPEAGDNLDSIRGNLASENPEDTTLYIQKDSVLNATFKIEGGVAPYYIYGDIYALHAGEESVKEFSRDGAQFKIEKKINEAGKTDYYFKIKNMQISETLGEQPLGFKIRDNWSMSSVDNNYIEPPKIESSCRLGKFDDVYIHILYASDYASDMDMDEESAGEIGLVINSPGDSFFARIDWGSKFYHQDVKKISGTGSFRFNAGGSSQRIYSWSPQHYLTASEDNICIEDVTRAYFYFNAKGGGEDPDFSANKMLVVWCSGEGKIYNAPTFGEHQGSWTNDNMFPNVDSGCLYASINKRFTKTEWGYRQAYIPKFEVCDTNTGDVWCPQNPIVDHSSWKE